MWPRWCKQRVLPVAVTLLILQVFLISKYSSFDTPVTTAIQTSSKSISEPPIRLRSHWIRPKTIRQTTESNTPMQYPVEIRELYVSGFSRPHPELCPLLGAKTRLVILIASAPSNKDARHSIRVTWGHAALRADVAIAFILGKTSPEIQKDLDEEEELYADLIQAEFVDAYVNLTLKSIAMLEWVDKYCPKAAMFLKADDDMFVNVERMLGFADAPARRNATRTIWGRLVHGGWPMRYRNHRYYVPRHEYDLNSFPDYVESAYLVTGDAVPSLARAAKSSNYLRLEDVFITGLVAGEVSVKREHVRCFLKDGGRQNPCKATQWLAVHRGRVHSQGQRSSQASQYVCSNSIAIASLFTYFYTTIFMRKYKITKKVLTLYLNN